MNSSSAINQFELFDSPSPLFNKMLADIKEAKHYIYLEVYKFSKEEIGELFRDALAQKAVEGVEVKLLLDAWGTGSSKTFFKKIIDNGGEVRIFNTLRIGTRLITQSHRRNHRKLLIIDDTIAYIGSPNITNYCMRWRELTIKLEGRIAKSFKYVFNNDFAVYNKFYYKTKQLTEIIQIASYEIIRDVPSIARQRIMNKYLQLTREAEKSIYIETPYFLIGYRLRKALKDAANRGVEVIVALPLNSDVLLVDILRNLYLGKLFREGVKFKMYYPSNLHSKLILIDDKIFGIGSANFDYRSFRYLHEILLVGDNSEIINKLLEYKKNTLLNCYDFNYEQWEERPVLEKIVAYMLISFRYLF